MIDHNAIITRFKDKLESAAITGSGDIRLSRSEYVAVSIALTNLLLSNSELKATNRALVERMIERNNEPTDMDGGTF